MQEKTKKNTDISERILQMLEYLNINSNNFAKKIGYNRSQMLYDIINGKSKPSYEFFFRFLDSEYSEIISIEWLISGKSDMIRTNKISFSESKIPHVNCNECLKKDQLIKTLQKLNESQSRTIELLEEKISFDVRGNNASVADAG